MRRPALCFKHTYIHARFVSFFTSDKKRRFKIGPWSSHIGQDAPALTQAQGSDPKKRWLSLHTLLSTCNGTDDAGKLSLRRVVDGGAARGGNSSAWSANVVLHCVATRTEAVVVGEFLHMSSKKLMRRAAPRLAGRHAQAGARRATASLQTLAKLSSLEPPPARADRRNKKITASVALQIQPKYFMGLPLI